MLWKRLAKFFVILIGLGLWSFPAVGQGTNTVYAVLFYSPSCPHCHQVILEDLPPLQEKFGDALVVFMVDITTANGQEMAQSAYQYYKIPRENWVVPMMVVDDQVLIGSVQIPTQLPTITENVLASGGIAVPSFPAMQTAFDTWQAQQGISLSDEPIAAQVNDAVPAIVSSFEQDPVASTITLAILVGLLISGVGFYITRRHGVPLFMPQMVMIGIAIAVFLLASTILLSEQTDALAFSVVSLTFVGMIISSGLAIFGDRTRSAVIVLTGIGLIISGYMAYVEMTANPAVCGALGDCNAVQQSDYAFIMGVPVGVIGMLGYVFMLVTSLMILQAPASYQSVFVTMLKTVVVIAAVFTIYLTFLEPFVIGAVCAWCLLSAMVVMNLMWLVLPVVKTKEKRVVEYLTYQAV